MTTEKMCERLLLSLLARSSSQIEPCRTIWLLVSMRADDDQFSFCWVNQHCFVVPFSDSFTPLLEESEHCEFSPFPHVGITA